MDQSSPEISDFLSSLKYLKLLNISSSRGKKADEVISVISKPYKCFKMISFKHINCLSSSLRLFSAVSRGIAALLEVIVFLLQLTVE